MNSADKRREQAAQLRQLRAALGLDQESMGERLGVSREWVSKLENEKEEFSEFVLLKMEKIGQERYVKHGDATSHSVSEPPADPYLVPSEMIKGLRAEFDRLIEATNNDPMRIAWIVEQMRAYLAVPKHWRTNEELNRLAHRIAEERKAAREAEQARLQQQPSKTDEKAI